ncbi:MAG TPA: tripartite tricarboxylate transporter substrate binding protein [Quisquiliibacterium sp.]|nr:tripartite tricarboxylate transporter substrate binding protein [Quisquiliibacterium sp.]HPA89272.1 tripartite tricarboxylate transporter substrate binding protein [Quisquiliibacterium sp.]HQN10524.1 tripartite tricarboxylate transporter substrate binding protein [Quisquiliibacterium sp.]HQP67794.1 tripartite tricarboxylate transporter substrate binding protein [Quisquiliibacterium sp.]
MTTRRQFVALGALAAAPAIVRSQPAWPTRPVRLFVGSSAGGSVDIPTRNLAARLSQRFGQQFIVENRAGAGGVIAAQAVVKSDPDGYTWLSSGPAELFNSYYLWQNAGREFPYNPMKDLIPAALIQRGAGVLVVPAVLGVRNWAELLKRAKEQPGKLNVAVGGIGATTHLASELLKREAGIDVAIVPYRSSGQMFADLKTGQVHMLITTPFEAMEPIKRGELIGIAVSHVKRIDVLPDIPTFAELGLPRVVNLPFIALCAPAGTPDAIIQTLNRATIEEIAGGPGKPPLTPLGRESPPMSPAELSAFIASERERWAKVIKDADIKP